LAGKVAAKTANNGKGTKITGNVEPFKGNEFPTYFRRADGSMSADIAIPQGDVARVSFQTDVKNNYLTRRNHRGIIAYTGGIVPTHHLFNGKLTFTFAADKVTPEGTKSTTQMVITDNTGSGPFTLVVNASIICPRKNENKER